MEWNVLLLLTSFRFLHRFPCQCYLSRTWYTIVTHSSTAKMLSAQCMVQWQFRAWPPATGGTSVHHRHWRRWWSVFYILHCDSLIFLDYSLPCCVIDWGCEVLNKLFAIGFLLQRPSFNPRADHMVVVWEEQQLDRFSLNFFCQFFCHHCSKFVFTRPHLTVFGWAKVFLNKPQKEPTIRFD